MTFNSPNTKKLILLLFYTLYYVFNNFNRQYTMKYCMVNGPRDYDWSSLIVFGCVLSFLGPYEKCVREVCRKWHKFKGLYPSLNFYYNTRCVDPYEMFCEVKEVMVLGSVKSLNFRNCDFVDDYVLSGLGIFANLEELNLSGCNGVTNVGIGYVGKMRSLRGLKMCRGYGGGIEKLVGLESLEFLDLESYNLSDGDVRELRKIRSLSVLSLNGCNRELDMVGISSLSLRELDLRWCRMLSDGDMKMVGEMVGLEKLSLSGCEEVGDRGIEELVGLFRLRELYLDYCDVTDDGLRIFGLGFRGKVLKKLSLGDCRGVNDLDKFMDTPMGLNLEDLNVSMCKLMGGCNSVGGLGVLNVRECSGSGSFRISGLLGALGANNLRSLDLKGYGDSVNVIVGNLSGFVGLRELSIGSICFERITCENGRILSGLKSLRRLDIKSCDLSDSESLGLILSGLNQLESLCLFGCNINDEGLNKICGLEELQDLTLAHTCITDNGVREMMFNLRKLKDLSLSFCTSITDACIDVFDSWKSLCKLNMYLNDNISKEGKIRLDKMWWMHRLSVFDNF